MPTRTRLAGLALVAAACAFAPRAARAEPPASSSPPSGAPTVPALTPLLGVELRVGAGASVGGTSNAWNWLAAAPTLSLLAEYTIAEYPRVSLYGEAIIEGWKRGAFGVAGGVRVRPYDGNLRAGIGIVGMLAPYTHGGIAAMVGECLFLRKLRGCLDLEVVPYFLGSDLPANGIDAQLRLVLSVGFDAF